MPYNVRVINYKSGPQIRVYDELVGNGTNVKIDNPLSLDYLDINGEVHNVSLDSETGRVSPVVEYVKEPFGGEYVRLRTESEIEHSERVSRNRTLNNLYYDARSNEWEWFVTLTFSSDKVNRYDYDSVCGKLHNWLSNMRKKCPDMRYLVVPEMHKDGAWHFHGLLADCDGLDFVDSGKKDCNGCPIYNVGKYRFGFTTATKVHDTSRVSKYITKYITKDLCFVTYGKKRYWKSRNLIQAEKKDFILPEKDKEEFLQSLHDISSHYSSVKGYVNTRYFELSSDFSIDIIDEFGELQNDC